MAYSLQIVANALLLVAQKRGVELTHMKLQKLVFFMHAWSLALNNRPLVSARPQAWPYGPTFDSLFHQLKPYGSKNIDALLTELNPATGRMASMMPSPQDHNFWSLLARVWHRYGSFSAMQLSALAHELGGPWDQARKDHASEISDESLKTYYQNKLALSA